MKKNIVLILVVSLMALTFSAAQAAPPQAPPPPPAQNPASPIGDFINLTSSLSNFFGSAMQTMTQAIGYLCGGIQTANLFQQGTNIVNDMLVHGPKPVNFQNPYAPAPQAPPAPAPAPAEGNSPASAPAEGNAPATSGENPAQVAAVSAENMSNTDFSNLLKSYGTLASEEKNVLDQMKENPGDGALKEIYNQVRTAKLEKSTRIMAALNYDIEKKQFSKLNLLIEYINTNGTQTVKVFGQIIDSARGKLQFCLIEAKKFGLTMDIQVIEGKLKLVMSLGTGNFTPTAPPPSVPMDQAAPAPAPAPASGSAPAPKPEITTNNSTPIELDGAAVNQAVEKKPAAKTAHKKTAKKPAAKKASDTK